MKHFKVLLGVFAVALLSAVVLPNAQADTWNKKTVVTFNQPVEIPGRILPAGTYTFKLLDSPSDRHIVEIFNADGSQIITTVLAINDYRLLPTGDTVMKFNERPGDSPEALRAWFYPGDNFGQEFVYPKVRAVQLAQTEHIAVPAVAVDTLDDNAIKTSPIIAITPDEKEADVATVIETTPPAAAVATPAPVVAATPAPAEEAAPVAEANELPHTGSSMPLIALLGGLSISLALGLKFVLKLAS
ncbi:MAG: LPXTG cell wall anchor domain-containing protein [Candidatus Acidiferrum sp.]